MLRRLFAMLVGTAAALHVAPLAPASRASGSIRMMGKYDSEFLPTVTLEYCTRCNWMLRTAWLSQELLTTFNGTLASTTLIPNHKGGVFEVAVITTRGEQKNVWSREEEGRFPEAKELKQRVRDIIDPGQSLGHSDTDAFGDDAPPPGGTGKKALARIWSVIRGDRRARNRVGEDPRGEDA